MRRSGPAWFASGRWRSAVLGSRQLADAFSESRCKSGDVAVVLTQQRLDELGFGIRLPQLPRRADLTPFAGIVRAFNDRSPGIRSAHPSMVSSGLSGAHG